MGSDLARLCDLAAKYIGDYFEKLSDGSNLGFWKEFERKLNDIYKQKDNTATAKAELEALWKNTMLAHSNLICFAEEYKAVAKQVMGYSDKIHIDKLKKIFLGNVKATLVDLDVTSTILKTWIKYLNLGLKIYKTINK